MTASTVCPSTHNASFHDNTRVSPMTLRAFQSSTRPVITASHSRGIR